MNPSSIRRLRDHELTFQLLRNSQRLQNLLEVAGNLEGAEEVDWQNKTFIHACVLDRIVEGVKTRK